MDIVVLSHLRWDFVFQRPQHLMSRAARNHRVLFWEEPIRPDAATARAGAELRQVADSITVARPVVPASVPEHDADGLIADQLADVVAAWRGRDELLVWHYSVLAEPQSRALDADVTVFDCMDELRAFRGAPPHLVDRERDLIRRSDLLFTGGHSLWEAKRALHPRVYPFPSSVDVSHFGAARVGQPEPSILSDVGRPRLVYAGVIDERIDLGLLARLADDELGHLVLIGPVAKIDPAEVPTGPRIHRLGMRAYDELPALFAHADVGLMPFAMNEATRFISPTKTPEYLAAGLPVVSTPVTDVVRGYGDLPMVHIADGGDAFADACLVALALPRRLTEVDERLSSMSWDTTWAGMERLIGEVLDSSEAA